MAVIRGKERQPAGAFNLRPVFSFAVSFAAVAFATLFIIYWSLDNRTVAIADMPAVHTVVAAKPQANQPVKIAAVKKAGIAPAAAVAGKGQASNAVSAEKTAAAGENAGAGGVNMASSGHAAAAASQYNAVKTSDGQPMLAAAKVTPVPTTGNNLLDRDRAIVANNLIDPLKGRLRRSGYLLKRLPW